MSDYVNRQHMEAMGLADVPLGQPYLVAGGPGTDTGRCPAVSDTGAQQCARHVGHKGQHARGRLLWSDEPAPPVSSLPSDKALALSAMVEFLLARIAEEESAARVCAVVYPTPWDVTDRGYIAYVTADAPNFRHVVDLDQDQAKGVAWLGDALAHVAQHDPDRVLRECVAKRRLIDLAFEYGEVVDGEWGCCHHPDELKVGGSRPNSRGEDVFEPLPESCRGVDAAEPMLRVLASVYQNDPRWREEWSPTYQQDWKP